MARIYLIRHGETDGNKFKSIQGCMDLPLNAKGIEQAEKMANYFKDIPLDAIYCSSMNRACRTAEEVPLANGKAYRSLHWNAVGLKDLKLILLILCNGLRPVAKHCPMCKSVLLVQ